jgi:hypothetical protein
LKTEYRCCRYAWRRPRIFPDRPIQDAIAKNPEHLGFPPLKSRLGGAWSNREASPNNRWQGHDVKRNRYWVLGESLVGWTAWCAGVKMGSVAKAGGQCVSQLCRDALGWRKRSKRGIGSNGNQTSRRLSLPGAGRG